MFDKNLTFVGRHADYLRKLCPSKLAGEQGLQRSTFFTSNLEAIPAAAIVGFLYNRRSPEDKSNDKIPKNNIFLEQLNKKSEQLELDYRIIMLLHDKEHISSEERINRAFRYDRDEEKRAIGDEVYFSYMRGGIDVLYEKLLKGSTTTEEDVNRLFEFMMEFRNLFYQKVSMDEIFTMCNEAAF